MDLISRQAALDAIGEQPLVWTDDDDYAQGSASQWAYDTKAIKALPSAQPEQRWIPCSERLPETENEVLITVFDTEDEDDDDYVEVYKGFYQDHEWWTQWCHGCLKIKDAPCGVNIVTAWMPLPEPYKGGEQDE